LARLKDIGERKAIELILRQLEKMPSMPVPFGDDVATYSLEDDRLAILKTDMLVGKTDVPHGMSLWHAARKAVVMNVSDFAAKGVQPLAVLVSLGLTRDLTEEDLKQIGQGLNAGAREYGAYVVGGDTGEATDLIISVSLFGLVDRDKLVLRSGAKPGDLVGVTGAFGKTAAGLRILLGSLKARPGVRRSLVESVLMPRARLAEGLALGKSRAVSASVDSSDGLAWSLHEIARLSKVGFLIDRLPVDGEVAELAGSSGMNPSELALYGGEEYELVVTVRPELWKNAEESVKKAGGNLLLIGRATAEKRLLLEIDGRKTAIEPRGWEHFTNAQS
jgi:thiamine-monophosphate kinase